MTQEQKELLLKDLCARLPYGVRVHLIFDKNLQVTRELGLNSLHDIMFGNANGKPYLRPMSSMTDEERKIHNGHRLSKWSTYSEHISETIDWLNAHHFDYRGLIPMGLAIAVTEENNPYKE